ncbi:ABC transporter substrate-binding protein [Anaerovorax odorimutans]|uniref:ABC transporter substrate-binding protein n=1 Tax=Anaerovorax odorimutans TaxID=109327 RepID=UPI00041B6D98|nr:ABC transporter substrate-binding protein [Anaerovorax odorimutans]
MKLYKLSQVRNYFIIILIISLLISCTGCNLNETNKESNLSGKTITDCIGREVVIPEKINRVAALDSFAGEAMVILGAGEKMVATPNGVQRDKLLVKIYPELTTISVPMSGGTISAESILSLDPDVILLKNALYLDEGEINKLNKLKIPYLVVNYTTMEEQIFALDMIGKIIGGESEKKAVDINKYYEDIIKLTAERAKLIPQKEKLRVYHSINEAVRTDGEDSLGADWTRNVGFINVSVGENLKSEDENYYCGMEQIFNWDPDVIICNDALTMKYLLSDSKWTGLRAVYENKVYNIPVGATRWGQQGSLETFLAMLWAGTTLYPEYYKDINLHDEVFSFYKNYLNLTLDEETYNMILLGEGIRTSGQNAGK